ncbi:hypothetical protein JYU34_019971 [Plutella xylostella]|uniref:Uncharacterized protein n=1 Tax=Plutella xylostella TaxID=51655 RepID=A0ABQ7PX62_PLUXY|nr:hypothetical protein JYU34_019971 [Plutella xylostella]
MAARTKTVILIITSLLQISTSQSCFQPLPHCCQEQTIYSKPCTNSIANCIPINVASQQSCEPGTSRYANPTPGAVCEPIPIHPTRPCTLWAPSTAVSYDCPNANKISHIHQGISTYHDVAYSPVREADYVSLTYAVPHPPCPNCGH